MQAAENGQQAIDEFQAWHPHFIWMDMRMPAVDGYEATKTIRALPGGEQVKIVALTASAFHEDRTAIIDAGCDDIVGKPLEADHLLQRMGELLGLKYRYGDEPAHVSTQEAPLNLSTLPADLLADMQRAANTLDLGAFADILDRTRQTDPAIAATLDKWIQEFRFDKVLDALDRHGISHKSWKGS